MSDVKICDICGERVTGSGRYELIYRCWLRDETLDICNECVQHIKEQRKK